MTERESLIPALRLTAPQRRHLREMLTAYPEDPPMVWTTRRDSPENRCAVALVRKGLLERVKDYSSWAFNHPAFVLTERGLEVARELPRG